MTSLSTHVLDTAHGCPAAGVSVRLLQGETLVLATTTNGDGRCPDFAALVLEPGGYRLDFAIASYFRERGVALPEPPFLDIVTIDFGIADDGHYHVPLLVSPFGFSTYRGS